jgi:uncharacterized membrane protein
MSKFVVVIFPNETKAYEGTRALKELDAEGSLALYGLAVATKGASGQVSLKEAADQGPLGTAVGALTGGLVGLLGGPVGAAVGLTGGTLIGSLADLFNAGVGADFVDEVSQKLLPGNAAVVAEVDEFWTTPLDTRMHALGGFIVRRWRSDVEDEQYQREITALKAEYAELQAEYRQARDETKAKLKARLDETQQKLEGATRRAQVWVDQRREETEAKVKELQARAARANVETRAKIDPRIAEVRADYERREAKLKQAAALTKEALAA